MINREEWLKQAVYKLDVSVFNGDLDSLNHKFQITCGICPGKKLSHTIQPYDGEDVRLDDFFRTTISINHSIKDPIDILSNLARECVFAFFNESKLNKNTKKLFDKYGFEAPFTGANPSLYLNDILEGVYKEMVKEYGEFPGDTVVIHEKDKKESKKNTVLIFRPECGYEIKVTRKMHEKHGQGTPTCVCGCKMGVDYGEEVEDTKNENI